MPAQRTLKLLIVVAAVVAAVLGAAAWMIGRKTSELMDATSAAQTQKQELAQERARLQQAATDLSQSAEHAREQAGALHESIEDSRRYQRDQRQLAQRAGEISKGLSAAAGVKVAMTEHYMTMGQWPASNEELGLPTPGSYKMDTLQSVAVETGGRIRMVFDNDGVKERLVLNAYANPAGQISWRCSSPDIADITRLIPGCSGNMQSR